MDIAIDKASNVPPFVQLRVSIMAGVRDGSMAAGMKLPTVRALAEQLSLAVNTVAKVYRELEQAGVIETRGRSGTFVASSGDPTRDHATRAAADYLKVVRGMGFSANDALKFVRAAAAAVDQ